LGAKTVISMRSTDPGPVPADPPVDVLFSTIAWFCATSSTNEPMSILENLGEWLIPNQERRLRDQDLIGMAGDQVLLRFLDPVKTMTIDSSSLIQAAPRANTELIVDSGSRDVTVRGAKLAPALSKKEFDVLELLYLGRGNAVSRDEIAKAGWPERPEADVAPAEIDQYIRRLRLRIEENPSKPKLIVTLKGHGYRIP